MNRISFPPGEPVVQKAPLERFLPPLERGSVGRALALHAADSEVLIDPFGTSPQLAIEAARAGYGVIVAANNPVTRFIIEKQLNPLQVNDLQAALAKFSSTPKDDSRLEPFILDLYRTICSRCGQSVSADYFIWERDNDAPFLKAYHCNHCDHSAEEATSETDRGRAQSYSSSALHYAMALEQLAPAGDPYRRHAEAALSAYPGRALYALITLISKLDQFGEKTDLGTAARGLLLYAFDTCNALWDYPEGRVRPRRLSTSGQYKEHNVWRALEDAVGAWIYDDPGIPLQSWPESGVPLGGTVAIYPGSAWSIAESFSFPQSKSIAMVPPRPNQAFWTLAALWTAWLWGKESAQPIKVALRRRRYHWAWHARALRAVMEKVASNLEEGTLALALLPEAEPGFLSAVMAGLDAGGLRLRGVAVREAEAQALLSWRIESTGEKDVKIREDLQQRMSESSQKVLLARGEPAPYITLHTASFSDLAKDRLLGPYWEADEGHPQTILSGRIDAVLYDRESFIRLGRGTEPESGQYWLTDPTRAMDPLADRVELEILDLLREHNTLPETKIIDHIYQAYAGLLTPNRRLVMVCLNSYAEKDEETRLWRLRSEDRKDAREEDTLQIRTLLIQLGERLGYEVVVEDTLDWRERDVGLRYKFIVQESANFGKTLTDMNPAITFVLPGGRSTIVLEKARHDQRISDWLRSGPKVIKFRHIRRLEAETTLRMDNLDLRLAIDPPDQHDPQLPLL
jgi:hypothetical protein